jgi:biotin-(acetyl-CoA carboxylase) ligase
LNGAFLEQQVPVTRVNSRIKPGLDLPPTFRLVTLREVGDAFAHAKANAAELGAGTLVYVGRFDLAEFAVVLEPDEPLRSARRVLYAGLAALSDALLARAPPEKEIRIVWPDAILVDQGLVGGGRLAWPEGDEDAPPAWLVFGGMIRTVSMTENEPGVRPLVSALEEEGFDVSGSGWLVESFARHLMVHIDAWQEQGFAAVAKTYLPRLGAAAGVRREIEENGDLVLRRMGETEVNRRRLVPALTTPSWLDPQTGGPK